MAEAFLKRECPDFEVESAGLEAGALNPYAVAAMAEVGIDISGRTPRSLPAVHGRRFDVVIAVCDAEASRKCPVFPGEVERLHWPFPDPASFDGSHVEKMQRTREVRDAILRAVKQFCVQRCGSSAV